MASYPWVEVERAFRDVPEPRQALGRQAGRRTRLAGPAEPPPAVPGSRP